MILFLAVFSAMQMDLSGNLNKDLNKFFDSFGSSANVSSADIYNGQKAGYATGGSMTVRNRVLNSKVATINLPKVDAGCGGIDLYAGGFSFINNEKLVETLKSIASSSIGYAFFLGIETVSPQIANQMRGLQSWANHMNGIGINSCETAAQMVGSVWPRNEIADQHICRTLSSQQGTTFNFLKARERCNTDQSQKESENAAHKINANLLYGDYNLAWKAIQQQNLLASHKDLAEFFMTITGTIVCQEEEEQIFPSKVTNAAFLKVLLEGGSGTIYRCGDKSRNDQKCLTVTEENLIISPEASWTGKVQAILIEIQNKIVLDEELSEPERAFLATSSLPLYKIVNVLTSYKHGICPIDLINISDVIAMDMLMQCLREGLEVVRVGCQQLQHQQMYGYKIEEFIKDLNRVENEIKYYETRAMRRLEQEIEIMKKIQMIEEQIAIELGF
jgi:conjugative transfer pilus assembly protein TraH